MSPVAAYSIACDGFHSMLAHCLSTFVGLEMSGQWEAIVARAGAVVLARFHLASGGKSLADMHAERVAVALGPPLSQLEAETGTSQFGHY